jgi:predicted Zn-dependent protease with MMP-like domain
MIAPTPRFRSTVAKAPPTCYVLAMPPQNNLPPDFWTRLAEAEISTTLRALPAPLRARLQELPIQLQDHPASTGLPACDHDLLGLFEGPCYGDPALDLTPLAPTITLFLDNLRAETGNDPIRFRQEVRTTLLHEIGHFLGLDEDDLLARDLQ